MWTTHAYSQLAGSSVYASQVRIYVQSIKTKKERWSLALGAPETKFKLNNNKTLMNYCKYIMFAINIRANGAVHTHTSPVYCAPIISIMNSFGKAIKITYLVRIAQKPWETPNQLNELYCALCKALSSSALTQTPHTHIHTRQFVSSVINRSNRYKFTCIEFSVRPVTDAAIQEQQHQHSTHTSTTNSMHTPHYILAGTTV